ncbi:hypothetical protein MY04_2065 [Flammeovirga sp. MY04]|uniref:hypothetical protein n=1 Tax=Flammeovirga sp. MY04 TaxID=1191459 RepID=UPI000806175D|nr:hypothetical protein [Flammeovirga sp. MY04]ANQ49439.1 hypothetical protein MY04_2065 [Flammeovirga sp. MY04]
MDFIEIYRSDFQTISYTESFKIIKSSWNTPINLSEKIYRNELTTYLDKLIEKRPEKVLVDAIKAYYQMLPETQNWFHERSSKVHNEVNMQKMAWIVSVDVFSQMTFDQAVENLNEDVGFQLKYFDNVTEAENWIN